MRLLIYLAVWKRPEITEICFMGIDRLRQQGKHEIDALAVISEDEMIPLCEKYGIRWVMHENFPLGRKKNFGLKEAMKLDFDYLVEIGSDDLLKNEFLDNDFDGHVTVPSSAVLLDTRTGKARMITQRDAKFGAGRVFSKEAIAATVNDGMFDNNQNKGLDGLSWFRLAQKGYLESHRRFLEPVVIDLKSNQNIWKFSDLEDRGIEYPISKALKGLSEQEINAIKCLIQKGSEVLTNG
jgi:hypothetical protein